MCIKCDSYNVPATCEACGQEGGATVEGSAATWRGAKLYCINKKDCQERAAVRNKKLAEQNRKLKEALAHAMKRWSLFAVHDAELALHSQCEKLLD